jgi:FAD/FMN-containing dehydrogenase
MFKHIKTFLLLVVTIASVYSYIIFRYPQHIDYRLPDPIHSQSKNGETNEKARFVNDVTGLNQTLVASIATPSTYEEVQNLVRSSTNPISIGGVRYSMGGQTSYPNSLNLDMTALDKILSIDTEKKIVIVQSGATWRKVIDALNPKNLSVKIMQSYANFTVGGSLSVNVHGRYVGFGPIISSVLALKVVLPDGSLVEASREKNQEIFYGCIGGYGGIGVIVEATLSVTDNTKLRQEVVSLEASKYREYFLKSVANDQEIIFQNGDILPPDYTKVYSVAYRTTTDEGEVDTSTSHVYQAPSSKEKLLRTLFMDIPYGMSLRKYLEPLRYSSKRFVMRNAEAAYDVSGLYPIADNTMTYVLQEYFIPVEKFDEFRSALNEIMYKYDPEILNISIRHAKKDEGTLLAWAKTDVFAFVVYYRQGKDALARYNVYPWTRALISHAIALGGSYYLPYQLIATPEQFHAAYPQAEAFFALKSRVDPKYKLRNSFFDLYYRKASEKLIVNTLGGIPHYARPEEQTLLTFPEWELVFISQSLAATKNTFSSFPFFSAAAQFWKHYYTIATFTWKHYSFNPGYHFMNAIIGATTTIEYTLKGIYEKTFGRIFEYFGNVKEQYNSIDYFMKLIYNEYAQFIEHTPWYEYDFFNAWKKLWVLPVTTDQSKLRFYERKLVFSVELLLKGSLAEVFQSVSNIIYGSDARTITALLDIKDKKRFDELKAGLPHIKIIKTFEGSTLTLASFPRYRAFTEMIKELALKNGSDLFTVVEIASNKKIALSYLVPALNVSPVTKEKSAIPLLKYPLLHDQQKERVFMIVDVSDLLTFIKDLDSKGFSLEHIFDY